MKKRECQEENIEQVVFRFETNALRTVGKSNEPWFVAKDVCDALEIKNARQVIAKQLDEDEVYKTYIIDSLGRKQKAYVVNESGLYALIMRSNKAKAKKFRKWVTSEVLPAIFKKGGYINPAATTEQIQHLQNALEETRLRKEIAETKCGTLSAQNQMLWTGLSQLKSVFDVISPDSEYGDLSQITGKPKTKLVKAYHRTPGESQQSSNPNQLVLPFDDCNEMQITVRRIS